MANIFQNLQIAAFRAGITPRTKQSRDWFRQKASQLSTSRLDLMKQEPLELRNRHGIGNMYMYFYDPKHKDTLPYYDRFPLTIVVEPAKGGFLGLNLHYLPIPLRIKLLDRLVDYSTDTQFDENTKLAVDYSKLKSIRLIKPTIHKYLAGQVKSNFRRVDADEFTVATLLPVQRFKKASDKVVWSDSRGMV